MSSDPKPSTVPLSLRVLLYLMSFSAFLTGVRFLPGISNNVGPFEFLVGVTAVLSIVGVYGRARIVLHPLNVTLLLIVVTAIISVVAVDSQRVGYALVQLVMLVALTVFTIVIYNLIRRYNISPEFLLTTIVYAILALSPWLLSDQIFGATISSVGPFRNRTHMGMYMLTTFWLSLMLLLWPDLPPTRRIASLATLLVSLYGVAASGRRSVYLSLGIGLSILLPALFMASSAQRARLVVASSLVIAFVAVLYTFELTPQLRFFQDRVTMVDQRLQTAMNAAENDDQDNFMAAQFRGVRMAFRESPIIGVGWGGFAESRFSATGHEVHSTPLRFLAETGLVGFALYVAMIAILVVEAASSYLRMRESHFAASYLTLAIALSSMAVSWLYNRHITERAFWLFLGVFLACSVFASNYRNRLVASNRMA